MKTYGWIFIVVVAVNALATLVSWIGGWDFATVYGFVASGAMGLLIGEVMDQRAKVADLRRRLDNRERLARRIEDIKGRLR